MLIPHRAPDVEETMLPRGYQRILAAVRQAAVPVKARQVGDALGIDVSVRAKLRTAGLGAPADLGRGLDNDLLDPVIVTGYAATRTHKLTPGQKTANRVLAVGRAPAEHGFAHSRTGGPSPNSASTPPAPPVSFALCSTSAP
ncbi:hypothetical protein ACLQ18_42065 [Streptomyces sp. DT193]|uniref:hypothetical protein n=1 Tax=Streptomyces sp. DT193 TaxID=3393418 RepID=UPI003CECB789